MRIFITSLIFVLGIAIGLKLDRHSLPDTAAGDSKPTEATQSRGEQSGHERKILYWWDPMIPDFRSDKPGLSPMGMEMVPVYEDEAGGEPGQGDPGITIAPQVVNNLGVRTAKVERGTLARRIDTVGYLDYDESRLNHVHVRVEGWIQRLMVKAKGERVEKGRLLFELYSPALVNAQEEYLQALAMGNQRLIRAARGKLTALGISDGQMADLTETRQVEQVIRVYAHHHQGGVVSELMVREGMYLKPDTEIMTLADLGSVWLLAEVFERQASWVEIGQAVEARVPSFPEGVWKGQVDYIYPDLDPVTRTLRVRLRFDNPGELLKPKMFAHVTILTDPRQNVLSIPREALIRDGGAERVVLALGQGRFQPREVVRGIESGDHIEIREGLAEGDTVVVSAQFLLDSEASLRGSFRRMEPPPGMPPGSRPEHGADEQDAKRATASPLHGEPVVAQGILKAIQEDSRSLTIEHEPLPSFGWSAGNMEFRVAEGVSFAEIAPGSRVQFTLRFAEDDRFVISELHPIAEAGQEGRP
jgi:membrane fusion protein, copper/silver efflux system